MPSSSPACSPTGSPDPGNSAGSLIRALRGDLSQKAVCTRIAAQAPEVIGVIPTSVSHWESGRRAPLPHQLRAFLLVLGKGYDPDTVLRLLRAIAEHPGNPGHLYGALLRSWPPGLSDTDRVASFHAWASGFYSTARAEIG